MRLVIQYHDGDGCTYSCDITVPVVYESAEAFAVDFEKFCKDIKSSGKGNSLWGNSFAGQNWDVFSFFEDDVYYPPQIYTIDEWFDDIESKDSSCPVCGEDGGTQCGSINCGY